MLGPNLMVPVGAGLASVILFAASFWVPPVGFVLCLASPLPVALAAWRWGARGAVYAAVAGTLGAQALAGSLVAVVYVSQFAAGGSVLGLTARARRAPEIVIGGYALLAITAFWAILGYMAAQAGTGAMALLKETLRQSVESATHLLLQGDLDPQATLSVQTWAAQTSRFLALAFPGLFAVLATLTGWANAVTLRKLVSDPRATSWTTWRAPEPWIWVLIGSGLIGLLQRGALGSLGVNVFVAALGVYFLQGFAVVQNLFEVKRFPFVFRAAAYLLLFLQLPVMLLVAGLGTFDMWFDFRSRWSPRPPAPDPRS